MTSAYLKRMAQTITNELYASLPVVPKKVEKESPQFAEALRSIYGQINLQKFPQLHPSSEGVDHILSLIAAWRKGIDAECQRMEAVTDASLSRWTGGIVSQYKDPLSETARKFGLGGHPRHFLMPAKSLASLICRLETIRDFREQHELEVMLLGADVAALYQYEKLSSAISMIDFPEFPNSMTVEIDSAVRVRLDEGDGEGNPLYVKNVGDD